jgi:hypothetical protein
MYYVTTLLTTHNYRGWGNNMENIVILNYQKVKKIKFETRKKLLLKCLPDTS